MRYSADVERAEPDFDQSPQALLDQMKTHMTGSLAIEGVGLVVRDAQVGMRF